MGRTIVVIQIHICIFIFKCADTFSFFHLIHFTGVLTTAGLLATGFMHSKYQPSMRKNPYLQYIMFGALLGEEYACGLTGIKPEVFLFLCSFK